MFPSKILKQETSGIEPPTSRSAVECCTELHSLKTTTLIFQNVLFKTMLLALFMKYKDSSIVDYRCKNIIKDMKVAQAVANAFKRSGANQV